MTKQIVKALLIAVVVIFSFMPRRADACTCSAGGSTAEALAGSDAVFEGRVESVTQEDPAGFFSVVVRFEVLRAWKGAKANELLTVRTGAGSTICGISFTIGQNYLVYARKHALEGFLQTGICYPTKLSSRASDDFIALGEPLSDKPPANCKEHNPGEQRSASLGSFLGMTALLGLLRRHSASRR
jgi:hypothetical protein